MKGIMANLNTSVAFVLDKERTTHTQNRNVKQKLGVGTELKLLINNMIFHHLDQ